MAMAGAVAGGGVCTAQAADGPTAKTATYTISGRSLESSGDIPDGSNASYFQQGTSAGRLEADERITFQLEGYEGMIITGVSVNLKGQLSFSDGRLTGSCGSGVFAWIDSFGAS